jgi:hypothetical protein
MSSPLYTPTDKDFSDALTSAKVKDDLLKLESVRNVLLNIFDNRGAIVQLFQEHVKNDSDELVKCLNHLLPVNRSAIKAKEHGMVPCSHMIIGIYHLFENFISLKSNDKIPKQLQPLMDMMDVVKKRVFDTKVSEKNNGFVKADLQRSRPFMVNASEPSDGNKSCVLCGHFFVDFPDTNAAVMANNRKKMSDYNLAKQAHEKDKTGDQNKASINNFHVSFYIIHGPY